MLAGATQLGYAVIPPSTQRDNPASNLKAQQLRLTDAEMAQIAALDRGRPFGQPGRPGTRLGLTAPSFISQRYIALGVTRIA